MPSRIIGFFTAVAAFVGLKPAKPKPDVEDLIVNSFNESHKKWVARGWIKQDKSATQKF